ncbi:unnamed protein product [Urochloa humidicola]
MSSVGRGGSGSSPAGAADPALLRRTSRRGSGRRRTEPAPGATAEAGSGADAGGSCASRGGEREGLRGGGGLGAADGAGGAEYGGDDAPSHGVRVERLDADVERGGAAGRSG